MQGRTDPLIYSQVKRALELLEHLDELRSHASVVAVPGNVIKMIVHPEGSPDSPVVELFVGAAHALTFLADRHARATEELRTMGVHPDPVETKPEDDTSQTVLVIPGNPT
jgi:hypothetical protein